MKLFNGKKIIGEPTLTRSHKTDQADPQIMFDALDKILSYEGIESIKWRQYTPFFNDGDICEFSVREPYVKLVGEEEGGENGDGYFTEWDFGYYKNLIKKFPQITEQFLNDFRNFSAMLVNGTNEDILYETFGDHAEITATKENITIEDYSHD